MRRKHNRATAAALASAMLAGTLAACSGGGGDAPAANAPASGGDAGAAKKSVTFTWLANDRVEGPVRNDWEVYKELEQRTGFKIEFQAVPQSAFEEKKKVLIATNSTTDFMMVTNQEGREHGPEKVFLNLQDYLAKAPNIKKFFDENPEAKAQSTAANGGLYTVPQIDSYIGAKGFNHAWYARKDLMDQYGLKAPTSPDELYQFLKGFKGKHPDSYPLTFFAQPLTDIGVYSVFLKMFTGLQGIVAWDPTKEQFGFAGNEKGFKDAILYMNKLYAEKLLDPEYALLTRAQYDERFINDKSFVTFFWKADMGPLEEKARKANGNQQFNFDGFLNFAASGIKNYQFARPVVGSAGIAIAANTKDKDSAVKLMDYILGDEGRKLFSLGIEGKTYKMVNGQPRYLEEFGTAPYNILRRDWGVWFPNVVQDNAIARLAWESGLDEETMNVNKAYEPIVVPAPRSFVKTKEEQDLEKSKLNNLNKYVEQKLAEFVTGKSPITDESLAQFVEQSKKLGAEDIVNMYNTAYKRTYGGK